MSANRNKIWRSLYDDESYGPEDKARVSQISMFRR